MIKENNFTMNKKSTFFCQEKYSCKINRLFCLFLFFIFLMNSGGMYAQSGAINGQVLDTEGTPLIGVTVAVKDKNVGVFTDEAGLFSVNAAPGDILVFSMISMQTVEVKVEKGKPIRIIMKPDEASLEEVVVVGYGKQKKVTITGSVSSVNMDDVRVPVANLSNALQGKVAGIISVQSSGEPGYDNSTFTIRGIGTFTGNTSPLVIVDGVQRDDVNSTYGGAYNNIDPEDIQSISLLKDASATAVYGAKGANGVLIINTKRGEAGKPRISLKVETGLTSFTIKPKMLDGVDYMKLYNEGRRNAGLDETYSQEQIMKTASGLDPYMYPNVNWIEEVYKKNSSITNFNMNINGGGEAVRYYLSASIYSQTGPYKVDKENGFNPNLDYKRYDFRSNVDVNVTPTTLLQLNLAAMLVDSKYPGITAGNLWYLSYSTTPIAFPVRYPDGRWAGPIANAGNNPKNEVQNNGYTTEFNPSVQSVFTLNQKLDFVTPGLTSYARFSFDSYSKFYNKRTGGVDLWRATGRDGDGNLIFGNPVKEGTQFLDYSRESSGERVTYIEGNIAYDRAFDLHRVGAMVLYNMRNRLVSTSNDVIGSIAFRNQVMAGRLSYVYNDKYLTEFNASYTGSENFAKGNKFGFFPAVSAGWIVSAENFFQPLSKVVSLLKLRGSYGVVGNDNIANDVRFAYITQIGNGNTTGLGLNGVNYTGLKSTIMGVEDLTWEKSYKTNIGLEVGLFNKVNLILDAYKERRKQILIPRQSLPGIAGFDTGIYANMGEMDNKGFDANIEYIDQIGKVGLRVYGNVTYSKNKIVFQDEPVKKYGYQSAVGSRFGEFYGYVDQGLFVDQNDIDAHPSQFGVIVRPGDIKYMNLNPNDDSVIDSYDQTYLGKSWFPTWSYGMGFNVNYHNFDLSLFFQGIADVAIMANGESFSAGDWGVVGAGVIPFSGMGQYPNNVISKALDRWTEENPRQDAYYPRLSYNNKLEDNNYKASTRWLKDGSYIRLKQASVGYTLNHSSIKKVGLSYLYFYVSGQNLLTFSKFKLWDPELGSNGAKYPMSKMVTFGIRAQF